MQAITLWLQITLLAAVNTPAPGCLRWVFNAANFAFATITSGALSTDCLPQFFVNAATISRVTELLLHAGNHLVAAVHHLAGSCQHSSTRVPTLGLQRCQLCLCHDHQRCSVHRLPATQPYQCSCSKDCDPPCHSFATHERPDPHTDVLVSHYSQHSMFDCSAVQGL